VRLHDDGAALSVHYGHTQLLRYVYRPAEPQLESPRPYLHPLRTLAGDELTAYRPDDHVWHKGLSLSLPHVGSQNLWGGVTWIRGHGYQQLDNNGSMRHVDFADVAVDGDVVSVDQRLEWLTADEEPLFGEQRRLLVRVAPAQDAWVLGFATRFVNLCDAPVTLGSPTTNGRPNAGYGGLFWRGPASFAGGVVHAPDRDGGDELMGVRSPWLALTGRDQPSSTVLMVDAPGNPGHPTRWFVRSTPFACLCPAPFFDTETTIAPASAMALRYAVVVAGAAATDMASLARLGQQTLVAWQ
jgi:hypothetical protein